MKKTFEYDLTKYSPDAPTRTEEFLTADGVKTLTTDANDGAVLLQDEVDGDSLNPVTGAAVAAAIEAGGGGGGGTEYSAGDGISIADDTISAKVDGTTIGINASGELEALGGGGSSYSAGAGIAINNDTISVNHDTSLADAAGVLPVEISGMMNTFRILPNASLTMDDTLSISCRSTSWAGVGVGSSQIPGYMRVKLTSVADPSKYVISTINCRKNNDEIYLDGTWSPYGLGGVAFNTYENAPLSYAFNWGSLTLDDIGFTTGSGVYVTLVMCDGNGEQLGSDLYFSGMSSSDWTVGSSAAPQRLSVANPVPSTNMASIGSVLTVGSTFQPEWAAPAGGGAGVEYVTQNNTYEEVFAIYDAGKLPVLECEVGSTKYFFVMTRYGANDGHYLYKGVFMFTQWTGSSTNAYTYVLAGKLGVRTYTCYRDGNGATQWSSNTSYILPEYGNSDAGKVLQVQSDGTLAWVTLS